MESLLEQIVKLLAQEVTKQIDVKSIVEALGAAAKGVGK